MSRKAMQMALEALESDPLSHAGLVSRKQAIAALRQAPETEQEPVAWASSLDFDDDDQEIIPAKNKGKLGTNNCDIPLYTAPAKHDYVIDCPRCGHCCQQQPEQEPVGWMHNFIEGNVITHIPADIGRHPERWTPLYTAPPKREWVGLTDDEVSDAIDDVLEGGGWLDVSRALEAKLREKNA